jgi:hypothetical protein
VQSFNKSVKISAKLSKSKLGNAFKILWYRLTNQIMEINLFDPFKSKQAELKQRCYTAKLLSLSHKSEETPKCFFLWRPQPPQRFLFTYLETAFLLSALQRRKIFIAVQSTITSRWQKALLLIDAYQERFTNNIIARNKFCNLEMWENHRLCWCRCITKQFVCGSACMYHVARV